MVGKISEDPDKVIDGTEKLAAEHDGDNYGPLVSSIATYLASLAQTLTGKTINASSNTISNLTAAMFASGVIDTDGALAANSDTRLATQKAVKAYADGLIAAQDAMVFKGVTDCSANPNYPAADRGHTYRVSVAGKIGGASGVVVEVGDMFICLTDATASGNQATVGASWGVIQTNMDGGVNGPVSVTDDLPAIFDGTTGKLIKSKTYAAFKTLLVLAKGDVGLGNVDNTSDATKNAAAVALTNKTGFNGVTLDANAWSTWVPTVTSNLGTLTALGTVVARYKQLGKTVFFYISIPITTNGTGAGFIQATLPFTAANTSHQSASGRENGLTGKSLAARVLSNTANLQFTFYDATYPGADGAIIGASGQYETV